MLRETSCLIFAAALALGGSPPQQSMSARDAFYSAAGLVAPAKPSPPAKKAKRAGHRTTITAEQPSVAAPAASLASGAEAPAAPLGLRYSILKQASDGRAAEVDPDRVFQSGDRIRLSIEANDTAHLYIVQR
ncbi:MAG TPA: hypothetical protein VEU62_15490, partial [Bryobacterales bacterium]|nr:hypothetical protein [Bryobacterales bacterium]